MRSSRNRRRYERGQVLSEYAFMLVVCAMFALAFFGLFAAFSAYGSRLIGLISWEPDPPDHSQMEAMMNGTL